MEQTTTKELMAFTQRRTNEINAKTDLQLVSLIMYLQELLADHSQGNDISLTLFGTDHRIDGTYGMHGNT